VPLIQQCRGENYRLVQMHATVLADKRIEYLFAVLGGTLDTLRIIIEAGDMLPSVSTYFPSAAFYENEIHDLFGVFFTAVSLDYGGNFYRLAQKTPYAPVPDPLAAGDKAGEEQHG
jgi:ech hydrogenase subunit D